MKNLFEMIFRNREDSTKIQVLSIFLLIGFGLFCTFIYSAKFNVDNLMVYITAFLAYVGFCLMFISSLLRNMKKKINRH
ncbi:hypothetical protein [Chryseobacterium sp. G0201]|uniref:hypothetical protein n=1 Tax=Chryseobacterium sp. G0201 TaxID=2487065 RepID=UPI000F4EE9FF|nr:hypothetical protein [Chryseobacterium sp. G0201]AZA54703.1 hypothetical protein EG348_17720 [Chryseobacterium sp. G0201]